MLAGAAWFWGKVSTIGFETLRRRKCGNRQNLFPGRGVLFGALRIVPERAPWGGFLEILIIGRGKNVRYSRAIFLNEKAQGRL